LVVEEDIAEGIAVGKDREDFPVISSPATVAALLFRALTASSLDNIDDREGSF
jgi:hypothetical protein